MSLIRPLKIALLGMMATAFLLTLNTHAQTLTINGGSACSYSQYVKTVGTNGVANFSFTASGCSTGGGSTPNLGSAQFTASAYSSTLQSTTRDVLVQRDNHVAGVSGSLSGSVTVDSGSASVCSIASPNFSFADGDTVNKTISVSANGQGQCNLGLSMTNGSASGRTTASFNVTPSNAIAFAAGTSSLSPGANTSLAVNRTDAGAGAAATSVSYTCTLSGFTDNANRTGALNFPANQSNNTQNIVFAIPTLSGAGDGLITCTLSNATPSGTIINSPTRSQPEHVVTVSNLPAPTCTPTATPNSLTAGTTQLVNLGSGCSANTNANTTYTWSRAPTNTTGPDVASTAGTTSSVNFATTVSVGVYAYRLVACNGANCTTSADINVTVNAAAPANCYQFDAPEPNQVVNNYTITVAKDRTSAMRLPKARLNNFTWYAFDSFANMQVSDQPCGPAMVDPSSLPLSSDPFRATCQFSIYTSYQSVALTAGSAACNVPSVPDGGFYYINIRPAQPNAQGTALTLATPTRTDICTAALPGSGGAACQYTLGF